MQTPQLTNGSAKTSGTMGFFPQRLKEREREKTAVTNTPPPPVAERTFPTQVRKPRPRSGRALTSAPS
jgi:hypothetical protein